MMTVGEKIRKLRRERNWTQGELGQRAGIDGKNVSSYESGRIRPTLKTLQRFAQALEVNLEELVSAEPTSPVLAVEDPELLNLFREIASFPESDQQAVKRVLELLVKQNRIQQMIAS